MDIYCTYGRLPIICFLVLGPSLTKRLAMSRVKKRRLEVFQYRSQQSLIRYCMQQRNMSDEGPSEKKVKMSDRIIVDSPLAPPAIGDLYFLCEDKMSYT